MIYFIIIPILLYVLIWICLIIGFLKRHNTDLRSDESKFNLSIIVPFRNETKRIAPLLNSLEQLDTSCSELEIIFVDDHSQDSGCQLVNTWINNTNKSAQLYMLDKDLQGKKKAINLGVEHSNSEWILTLDADTIIESQFLQKVKNEITRNKEFYILNVVEESSGFFISVIESYILSIITYTSAKNKKALLANGAGLLFKRKLFYELNPYNNNYHQKSGDDIFFLEKVVSSYPDKIHAISPKTVYVVTSSPDNYIEFLTRAVRWSGKMYRAKLVKTKIVGLITLLANINLLGLSIIAVFDNNFIFLFIILALKFFVDLLLLFLAIGVFGGINLIFKAPLVLVVYPFHLLIVLLYQLFCNSTWKGRKIN